MRIEEIRKEVFEQYYEDTMEVYKGILSYDDIVESFEKEVILPRLSNEIDPNVLNRRREIFLKSEKIQNGQVKIESISGIVVLYFHKFMYQGYVNLRYSKDILKYLKKILNSPSSELKSYIKFYGEPDVYILRRCNRENENIKDVMEAYREILQPEIGENKVAFPISGEKVDLKIKARRDIVKKLATWDGTYSELLKGIYKNCVYILEMVDRRIYVGSTDQFMEDRFRKHVSDSKKRENNLHKAFEEDISKVKIYLFNLNEESEDLKAQEQNLMDFVCPELNSREAKKERN